MKDIQISILSPNEFEIYQDELKRIFEENFFKNGGMLYSDDFMENSDFIVIAKMQNKIVAYMAIAKLTEKELDRKCEIYQEEPIMHHSIVIKHIAVTKEYRRQKIATRLFQYVKEYAKKKGIYYLYLWTTPNNFIAIDFYTKQGFYKMGDYHPKKGEFQGLDEFHSIMMVHKIERE